MIQRQEKVSILVAVMVILAIYLPLHWGWVTMSDMGSLVSALIVAGSILLWGFRDRIEQLLRISPRFEKIDQELTLLISPLYAKLAKNDEIIDFMATYKGTRIYLYSDSQRPNGDAQREELEKLEEDIKEIMLQYGYLASDELYTLIKKFQELEPDMKQDNSWEANKTLRRIRELLEIRQGELRTVFRSSDDKGLHNDELEKLIIPIYQAFDKYPDNSKMMEHAKFGLPMIWSLMSSPYDKSASYLKIEKADPIIDIMQKHGNLAQPELRDLIKQFLDFKQVQKERGISLTDPYFIDMTAKVNQIKDLATKRYNELMWEKEGG